MPYFQVAMHRAKFQKSLETLINKGDSSKCPQQYDTGIILYTSMQYM